MPSGALVLDLANVDARMLPVVGGKAANLGELIRAGLPVPLGVCATTEAYRQVAAGAAIDFDALQSVAGEDLKRVAGQAREAVLSPDFGGALAWPLLGEAHVQVLVGGWVAYSNIEPEQHRSEGTKDRRV